MKKPYIIRKAKALDVPALIPLFKAHAAFEEALFQEKDQEEKFRKALQAKIVHCLLVEIKGEVVGYTTFMKQFSSWEAAFYLHMDCLFLLPEARSQGIGEELIQLVKQEAKAQNCSRIEWQTPSFNKRAIQFYNRMGAYAKSKERFFLEL